MMPSENAPRSVGSLHKLPGQAPYSAMMATARAAQAVARQRDVRQARTA